MMGVIGYFTDDNRRGNRIYQWEVFGDASTLIWLGQTNNDSAMAQHQFTIGTRPLSTSEKDRMNGHDDT
mgnify:CR=1 FL=1